MEKVQGAKSACVIQQHVCVQNSQAQCNPFPCEPNLVPESCTLM
jgi:hypothetical protein